MPTSMFFVKILRAQNEIDFSCFPGISREIQKANHILIVRHLVLRFRIRRGKKEMKKHSARKVGRTSAFIALLISITVCILALFSELIMRLVEPERPDNLPTHFINNPTFYSYKPGFHFSWENEAGVSVSVSTDENGFRNPIAYLSKCEAILLGDSFVAGVNTQEEETLAGILRKHGLNTYNAGVDMFSTGEALQALKYLLIKSKPEIVILAFYQGNDFRDNLFVRLPKPDAPNLGGSLKKAYFSVAANSLLLQFLHTHLYLGILKGKASHPMASYTLSEISAYRNQPSPAMTEAIAKTDSMLGEFAILARERDFRFKVLGIPSKAAVLRSFKEIALYEKDSRSRSFALQAIRQGYSFDRPDSLIQALCHKHGVSYLSLLPIFRDRLDEAPYYRLDTHWRAQGIKIAADTLWKEISNLD